MPGTMPKKTVLKKWSRWLPAGAIGILLPFLLCVLLALPVYCGKTNMGAGKLLSRLFPVLGATAAAIELVHRSRKGAAKSWGILLLILTLVYLLPPLLIAGSEPQEKEILNYLRIPLGMVIGGIIPFVKSNKKYKK